MSRKPPCKPPRAPTGDYEVGWCRPPRANQFKPGQSGNPARGRRKPKSVEEEARAMLMMPLRITEGGTSRNIPTVRAMFLKLRALAAAGDMPALRLMLQLTERYMPEVGDQISDLLREDREILRNALGRLRDDDDSGDGRRQ